LFVCNGNSEFRPISLIETMLALKFNRKQKNEILNGVERQVPLDIAPSLSLSLSLSPSY
jgi:hypothetical protein